MTGLVVTAAVFAAGLVIGLVLRGREGKVRSGKQRAGLPAPVAESLGPGVTLVQISTTFCAPCRHTRARLSALAERQEGLRHVDIDVTNQPEVAHALGVLRTPTTIAYTASGTEIVRVSGLPETDSLLAALRPHLAA
ncbi:MULTISPECIES: thioredoxin family protein [Thermocrispum]|jgi:thiol-disulfide isomerase/thioredoxin|uniref:Thioredoxin family protein n=3 Tax=Thermocrispum agreste TaxID=37925 RepID=A0ABD6FIB4_9PSEU|nr:MULTISPECIES: thioredoxin family protein [Thermocrispum]